MGWGWLEMFKKNQQLDLKENVKRKSQGYSFRVKRAYSTSPDGCSIKTGARAERWDAPWWGGGDGH